jgi:hypothetical protein
VRDEELPELDTLVREACPYEVKGGSENKQGKANVLLQVGGWMGRVLIAGCSLQGCYVGMPLRGRLSPVPAAAPAPCPSCSYPEAYISLARTGSASLTATRMHASR